MITKRRDRVLIALTSVLVACADKHTDVEPGAAGGTTGSPSTDSASSHVGARASARLEPTEAAATSDGPPVAGEATFTVTNSGVDLAIRVSGCTSQIPMPVYIQEGMDCSAATLLGARWDGARGEGIVSAGCTGLNSGQGRVFYSRSNRDEKPWTIGNPAASNVLGHVLVVYDPAGLQPVACGKITREPDVQAGAGSALPEPPSVEIRAQFAGVCLLEQVVGNEARTCPDPKEIASCASEHCGLDACVERCPEYVACLQQAPDRCAVERTCPMTEACSQCASLIGPCVLGFCPDLVACAAPSSPDGPCARLEACCAMQGERAASCLDSVHLLEKFGGDMTCSGLMHDFDVNAHLPVPCNFE